MLLLWLTIETQCLLNDAHTIPDPNVNHHYSVGGWFQDQILSHTRSTEDSNSQVPDKISKDPISSAKDLNSQMGAIVPSMLEYSRTLVEGRDNQPCKTGQNTAEELGASRCLTNQAILPGQLQGQSNTTAALVFPRSNRAHEL